MAKLSDSRPTKAVTLSGGCVVSVFTSFTVADMRSLQTAYGDLQSIPSEKQADFSIDAVIRLIKTWDMVDDSGAAVLPTSDVLAALPQPDLKAILDTVQVKKVESDQSQSSETN